MLKSGMKRRKVMVIAPHMDDEVLGCGGVISRHAGSGDSVTVVFVAHRIYNHRFDKRRNDIEKSHALAAKVLLGYDKATFLDLCDERLDACVQDIVIPLERAIKAFKPDVVYLPFKEDNNQDHRAVFDAARVALRPLATPFIKEVHLYEVPSSTEQSPPLPEHAFMPNYYVDISGHMDKKLESFKCYATEKRRYPHPRSDKALRVLGKKRGIEIGFKYAEAFLTIRKKWS